MEPIVVLRKAVDQTGRIVTGVKADQLSGPTPCPEWDTRALLNHTIGGVEMFDDAVQTKPFTGSMFANDNVGNDPGDVVRATSHGAARHDGAARCPGPGPGRCRSAKYPVPWVPRFATLEMFQHGWDVANATGQQVEFDPDVTEAATRPRR